MKSSGQLIVDAAVGHLFQCGDKHIAQIVRRLSAAY